jgi:type VI secretion system secreted protein Hcp
MSSSIVRASRKLSCVIGAVIIFGCPMIAAASDLITLQMPNVPGDLAMSTALGLPAGSIEILALSDGVSNSISLAGTGGGAGKANFSNLSLSKRFDGASPALFLGTATGRSFPQALVTFYHVNNKGAATAYFTITLTHVIIASDQFAGSEKSSVRDSVLDAESFSLAYEQIQLTDVATAATSCWNVAQNNAC